MPLSYGDALAAIQARGRFGIRLGLGRTRGLLRELGRPEETLRGALIGGTNGKGSVQALVASVLRAAGRRVGQTPKPHLVSYRERIVVDDEPIAGHDFGAVVADVLAAAGRLPSRLGPPTEFELLTVAAFAWFARAGVEVAVVEVGLGGRLDATNAWDGGVAAVTNVELDHMDRLGSTREAIAREKAAIIKRGDRAVTGASDPGLGVIRRRARRMGVPLVEVSPLPLLAHDRGGLLVASSRLGPLRLGLLGRHQAHNAAVALAVLEALAEAGIASADDDATRRGLAAARWPGRLELLAVDAAGAARPADASGPDPSAPDVLLDGAHNGSGAAALAAAVDELRPSLSPGPVTLLLGLMGDKDVAAALRELAASEALASAHVVTTTVDSPRAATAEELAMAWRTATGAPARRGVRASAIDDPDAALSEALGRSRADGGPLVVAGSLYLVGRVRGRLVPGPHDA
ncbi:MAG TPA: Mur ligase family protein [Candidatus Limnocylindrales bacterium]|nr:Mur ligase family protein [Candidatus Limnocylindrales bacterium]